MQKSSFSSILREELTRATVFGVGFFVVLSFGFVSVTYAANGGLFGEVLNLILTGDRTGVAGRTWDTTLNGTVYNAEKLGGVPASDFVLNNPLAIKTCGPNQCMKGFKPNGDVDCIPVP